MSEVTEKKTMYYDKMGGYIRFDTDPTMPSELFVEIIPNEDQKNQTVTEYWSNQDHEELEFSYDPSTLQGRDVRGALTILRNQYVAKQKYLTNFMNTYKISVPQNWYDMLLENNEENEVKITRYLI